MSWYSSPLFTAEIMRLPSGNFLPAIVLLRARSITDCKISGRARFNSSRKSTTGVLSRGNQNGGRNCVFPALLSRSGKPIRSPGSLICPRKRGTTFIPWSSKYFVRICDFPIPCFPASIMFCSAGVSANTSYSSFESIVVMLPPGLYSIG